MGLLEPVVFPVQCHPPHRSDSVPTEIAETPVFRRIFPQFSLFSAFSILNLHHRPMSPLGAPSIADLKAKLPRCIRAEGAFEGSQQIRLPKLELL